MKTVDVCLTPDLIQQHDLTGKIVVVVDILRATSCMVAGLGSGVKSIKPFAKLDDCFKMREKGYLIAGERNGKKVEGFDLGNSPFGYMCKEAKGRKVATTTTNGTVAIEKSLSADKVIIGAFLNIDAVANYLNNQDRSVIIHCAGWKGKVNMEDTLFAGALFNKLEKHFSAECDSPLIAQATYNHMKSDILGMIKQSSHAKRLNRLDVQRDIEYCLKINEFDIVPVLVEGELIAL